MKRALLWLPVLSILLLIGVFAIALLAPAEDGAGDPLIGEALPALPLQPLPGETPVYDPAVVEGPYLLNVWASWCAPCRIEHPMLSELAASGVAIHAINYKDEPQDARAFLAELGDPFASHAADPEGRAGIELGLTGAPETLVVDADGVVRARWRGAITPEIWERRLQPAYAAAEERAGG